MITYAQARDIVQAQVAPGWRLGTFCLDDRLIVETDEYYAFTVGARELLAGGDLRYGNDGAVPVVMKATGELRFLPPLSVARHPGTSHQPNSAATFHP